MRKVFIIAIFTVLLISLVGFAVAKSKITGNEVLSPELYTTTESYNSSPGEDSTCVCPSGYVADGNVCNPKCYYSQPPCLTPSIKCGGENANTGTIVGAGCGTVTPGYQLECCLNNGYTGWNKEEWKCTNKTKSNDDNNETEEGVVCTMDVKVCPDGTQVGRTGEDCEFKCPKQYNISKEKVCCKISESDIEEDSNQTKIDIEYEITDKKECSLEEISTKKSREIVNNSYCINQIKENRQEFINKKWEIMQEKNRIKNNYFNQSECPDNCSCSGSTIRCEFENGTRILTITAGESGNVIVQVKNINASTNVTLYKADGKVYGVFTDNDTHQIILPDDIKDIIKEGKRTNWTDENITLNETGSYNVDAKKNARLFWIFPVKEKVQFSINSETGEITKTKTKWWGFLAKDVKEQDNSTN